MIANLGQIVSKSKRRYDEDGFNLDLSYIKKSIIAMAFPSEGSESLYRNPMSQVQRFLELKHKDHYKVYNLCSERCYDHKKFHYRVARYPFDDHNCPMFNDIWRFCNDVKDWLNEHVDNVAVIHCKAGKGRTGLMICCWLLFVKEWETADDAMKFYAALRTYNQKGVTIPSQIRYIKYFEQRMRLGAEPQLHQVTLSHMILHGPPKGVQEIKMTIYSLQKGMKLIPVFQCKKKVKDLLKENKNDKHTSAVCEEGQGKLVINCEEVALCGDLRFEFEKLMHFWIHTSYVQQSYVLSKCEVDKTHKDKKNKIFPSDFKVELCFQGAPSAFLTPASPVTEQACAQNQEHPQQPRSSGCNTQLAYVINTYQSLLNL